MLSESDTSRYVGDVCNIGEYMLTTTYAFLSLSIEQKRLHNLLSTVQRSLHISFMNRQRLDAATLKPVVEQCTKLDASCRSRKIERYVIPAIQKATKEADPLLAQLESSTSIGRRILDSVKKWVRLAMQQRTMEMAALYASIEHYCNNLLERLAKEEKELLPLAQRVISSDEWFAMGAQFLSIDTEHTELGQASDSPADASEADSVVLSLSDPLMSLVVGGDIQAG